MTQLRITDGKGLHLSFPNGVTISIQIGPGNYSQNYDEPFGSKDLPASATCEVAVWDCENSWAACDPDGYDVWGYALVDDALKIIPLLAALPDGVTSGDITEALAAHREAQP